MLECKMISWWYSDDEDDKTLKEIDHRFLKVAKEVSRDRKKVWTCAELHELYLDENDNVINDCRNFIQKLLNYFNGDLIPFANRGYLPCIVFKDHVMVVVKDAKDKDPFEGVVHIIAKECTEIHLVTNWYW